MQEETATAERSGEVVAAEDAERASAPAGVTSGGLVTAMDAVARELHAYRLSQRELQRSHELFLAVFQGTTDAVFVKDLGGRYLMCNGACAQLHGRPPEEVLGREDFEVFPTVEAQKLRRADRLIMTLAATRTFEVVLQARPELPPRTYLITEGPYRDGNANIVGVFGIARDITERTRAEAERAARVQELKESVRARDDFVAVASHELKTPLAALKLQMENTRRQHARMPTGDETRAWLTGRLEQTERRVDQLTRQVATLLDVTRVTSGKLELRREPTDLCILIKDVLARFTEEFEAAGSPLSVQLPELMRVSCDRLRVEQVVTNLITNALKYGAGGKIDVRLDESQGLARLSVRDRGLGIPREFRSRIFERFERVVPDRNIPGSGLGLWILREIVEAHGGYVRVHSRPGHGSRFSVLLPINLEG